jgi:hypothetical protein
MPKNDSGGSGVLLPEGFSKENIKTNEDGMKIHATPLKQSTF